MPRRPRRDEPGSWHHVVNRGIAKRPLFETRDDIRFFLSRIARAVREGQIEVHSFCVLTTHFHFLIRSPRGEMSEAFRLAQNAHSRRFNRRRKRDGALVRGRFFSRPVEDEWYCRTLVRYIDHNPVRARVVTRAAEYEFGSARFYAGRRAPIWLDRSWVEAQACEMVNAQRFTPAVYRAAFTARDGAHLCDLVEQREKSRATEEPLVDLIATTPRSVRLWMERKAQLADGHRPGLPVCAFDALREALEADESRSGLWVVEDAQRLQRARELALFGLGYELAGLSWREVALRSGESEARARRLGHVHRELVGSDSEYAERAAAVAREAIEASLGR
ncbi:MAG: transposase [Planctomycetota bacterium]